MTKRIVVAAALAVALACSSGSSNHGHVCKGTSITPDPLLPEDYTSNFTGEWLFHVTGDVGGYPLEPVDGIGIVTRADVNVLFVPSCVQNHPALVLDAATFEPVCYVCPTQDIEGCTVHITIDTNQGELDEGTGDLSINYLGTAEGCGDSYPFSMTWEGTPWEAVEAAPGDAPDISEAVTGAMERVASRLAR